MICTCRCICTVTSALLRFFLSASGLDAHPHLFNSESSRHDFSASCFPHLARLGASPGQSCRLQLSAIRRKRRATALHPHGCTARRGPSLQARTCLPAKRHRAEQAVPESIGFWPGCSARRCIRMHRMASQPSAYPARQSSIAPSRKQDCTHSFTIGHTLVESRMPQGFCKKKESQKHGITHIR